MHPSILVIPTQRFAETGPHLLQAALRHLDLAVAIVPYDFFVQFLGDLSSKKLSISSPQPVTADLS